MTFFMIVSLPVKRIEILLCQGSEKDRDSPVPKQ